MAAADGSSPPWLRGVRGTQLLPLILEDPPILRVSAGPGTGKTYGLRKRVLRLLHPDGLGLSPDRVLVCAFNRVIAEDLRRAISEELEPFNLAPPVISTIHALAAALAREKPRFLLPQEIEAMVYDVRTADAALDAACGGSQSAVMRAMRDHEAGLGSHPALATRVQEWLADHGADLVGDLPRRVETRLRGGDFPNERYDHVIIDEFQDLTEVEARLAIGLREADGQLVVLGDRKQSIYAFRGNEGRGLDALSDYVTGEIVDRSMDECQRCPSEVVGLANEVMAVYGEPLRDVQGPGGLVQQVHHSTPEAEHARIAKEVVSVFRARPHDKHLVLVTRRKWGYEVREAIRALDPGIRAQTVFAEDILETWPAREAFVFLSIVAVSDDPVALRDWISYREPDEKGKNWKAPQRNAAAYRSLRETEGVLTLARIARIANGPVSDLRGSGRAHVLKRCQRLQSLLAELPPIQDPSAVVAHVLDPSRWVQTASADAELATEDIHRLRREADRLLTEGDDMPLEELTQKLRYRIATREPLGETEPADVKIVTLWGAKGLTADYVYVIGLCDEALPGPYDKDGGGLTAAEHQREQLRLLYVTVTRARQVLVISRSTKIKRGQVPALHLAHRPDGDRFWQHLRQCQFFSRVSPAALPSSVEGQDWKGLQL